MQKKAKILIVDDEAIIRQSLQDWLIDANYEVLIAENGFQALALIEKESPDIALVDLVMSKMDGIELLKKAWMTFYKTMLSTPMAGIM